MILAGIDEAGLGPALGPLCVCATIFSVPEDTTPSAPWELLGGLVTAQKRVKTAPLLIADSKIAYGARGMAGLEEAAMSFLLACQTIPPMDSGIFCRELLLKNCGSDETIKHLADYPWYNSAKWALPAYCTPDNLPAYARAILDSPVKPLHLRAKVLTAGMLNSLFAKGLNKSELLLTQTGAHLRFLFENFRAEKILVIVDKQGGRNFYAPFLSDLLAGAWIETITEGAQLSEYRVENMHIRFMPKADRDAFTVALASIFAKYLRERFMQDFNAYFQSALPELAPTAGYHGDAPRFMEQIRPLLTKRNISEDLVWRQR